MEQCEQAVRFGQRETNSKTNYRSFKEEITNQYQPLEPQADKIPLRAIPVTTLMSGVASDNTYNNNKKQEMPQTATKQEMAVVVDQQVIKEMVYKFKQKIAMAKHNINYKSRQTEWEEFKSRKTTFRWWCLANKDGSKKFEPIEGLIQLKKVCIYKCTSTFGVFYALVSSPPGCIEASYKCYK